MQVVGVTVETSKASCIGGAGTPRLHVFFGRSVVEGKDIQVGAIWLTEQVCRPHELLDHPNPPPRRPKILEALRLSLRQR